MQRRRTLIALSQAMGHSVGAPPCARSGADVAHAL